MRYRVLIEQDEDGVVVAEVPALPGCISQGATRAEAVANIKEAIAEYIESLEAHNEPIPPSVSEDVVEVPPYCPGWSEPHLLSFVTDASGGYLAVHADLVGITMLISELEALRDQLELNDCPHTHLFSYTPRNELTTKKLSNQPNEANIVHEVKIYGWNEEWAVRHGLKT